MLLKSVNSFNLHPNPGIFETYVSVGTSLAEARCSKKGQLLLLFYRGSEDTGVKRKSKNKLGWLGLRVC